MTNQEASIKEISLSKIIESYSAPTVKLLVEKGIDVYFNHIQEALEKQFPDDILNILIDRLNYIQPKDIKLAKEQKRSKVLIEKMSAKCSDIECLLQ